MASSKKDFNFKGCNYLSMASAPTQDNLDWLNLRYHAAYIRTPAGLFYINKEMKKCEKIKLDEDKLRQLKKFDEEVNLSDFAIRLTPSELGRINQITGHMHIKSDEEKEEEKMKKNIAVMHSMVDDKLERGGPLFFGSKAPPVTHVKKFESELKADDQAHEAEQREAYQEAPAVVPVQENKNTDENKQGLSQVEKLRISEISAQSRFPQELSALVAQYDDGYSEGTKKLYDDIQKELNEFSSQVKFRKYSAQYAPRFENAANLGLEIMAKYKQKPIITPRDLFIALHTVSREIKYEHKRYVERETFGKGLTRLASKLFFSKPLTQEMEKDERRLSDIVENNVKVLKGLKRPLDSFFEKTYSRIYDYWEIKNDEDAREGLSNDKYRLAFNSLRRLEDIHGENDFSIQVLTKVLKEIRDANIRTVRAAKKIPDTKLPSKGQLGSFGKLLDELIKEGEALLSPSMVQQKKLNR